MKLLVISDTHDNIVRLKHVLGFAKLEKFAAVIHCGDWNTPLAVWELGRAKIKSFGVLGNADVDKNMEHAISEVCEQYDENFLELNLDNRKIGVCHYPPSSRRSLTKADRIDKMSEALLSGRYDILFCGHTHQRKEEKYGKTKIVNAGALHRTSAPCFVVYDTKTNEVEFIDMAI